MNYHLSKVNRGTMTVDRVHICEDETNYRVRFVKFGDIDTIKKWNERIKILMDSGFKIIDDDEKCHSYEDLMKKISSKRHYPKNHAAPSRFYA